MSLTLIADLASLTLLILFSSFASIVLHEMGHAIPIFFMSKERVSIYIGSFGDKRASLKIIISRLDIYVKYNPFLWIRGICRPPNERLSFNKTIFYIATGPITSVMLTLVFWITLKKSDSAGVFKFFIGTLFALNLIYSLSSILPFQTVKYAYNGKPILNDINNISKVVKTRKYYNLYSEIEKYIAAQQYEEASKSLDFLIINGYKHAYIYRRSVFVNIYLKDFSKANEISELILANYPPIVEDYVNAGCIKTYFNDHEEAVILYQKALEMDLNNVYALNNISYSLCYGLNKYKESFEYLNKAITIDSKFAHGYDTRGFAKIKIDLEGGFVDLNYSIQLDERNSFAFRNLGIYYLEKSEIAKAKTFFERAKEIEKDTLLIDEYLAEVENYEA